MGFGVCRARPDPQRGYLSIPMHLHYHVLNRHVNHEVIGGSRFHVGRGEGGGASKYEPRAFVAEVKRGSAIFAAAGAKDHHVKRIPPNVNRVNLIHT